MQIKHTLTSSVACLFAAERIPHTNIQKQFHRQIRKCTLISPCWNKACMKCYWTRDSNNDKGLKITFFYFHSSPWAKLLIAKGPHKSKPESCTLWIRLWFMSTQLVHFCFSMQCSFYLTSILGIAFCYSVSVLLGPPWTVSQVSFFIVWKYRIFTSVSGLSSDHEPIGNEANRLRTVRTLAGINFLEYLLVKKR